MHVRSLDGLIEHGGSRSTDCRHTVGHSVEDAVLHEVLHPAGIAEVPVALSVGLSDGLLQGCLCLVSQYEFLVVEQSAGYLQQFVSIVVGKAELIREAAEQSGVGLQHGVHLLLIAGKDDQHVGIGLRQHGQQRVDDPCAKVLAVATTIIQRVGLVNEEHVATRLL